MSRSTDAVLAAMRTLRGRWVTLEGAKKVRVLRPREEEIFRDVFKRDGEGQAAVRVELAQVIQYVDSWEGFTEADLMGPAGSGDVLAFDPKIWAELVPDRLEWSKLVAAAMVEMISEWVEAKAAATKNS